MNSSYALLITGISLAAVLIILIRGFITSGALRIIDVKQEANNSTLVGLLETGHHLAEEQAKSASRIERIAKAQEQTVDIFHTIDKAQDKTNDTLLRIERKIDSIKNGSDKHS